MIGEVNRHTHEGAEVAIAMLSEPAYSVVLRTMWRVKERNLGLGLGNNRRPDFQELLTDVRVAVWVRRGENERSNESLAQRVRAAFQAPSSVSRFGGLSLGESTHLIDEIAPLKECPKERQVECQMLFAAEDGDLSLPIWPDHVGSKTTWGQYLLRSTPLPADEPSDNKAWTTIKRKTV
jgi:CRISPR-associated protein Cas5t